MTPPVRKFPLGTPSELTFTGPPRALPPRVEIIPEQNIITILGEILPELKDTTRTINKILFIKVAGLARSFSLVDTLSPKKHFSYFPK